MLYAIHVVSVVLGLAGAGLVSSGRSRLGQGVWIPANLLWIWWSLAFGDLWGAGLFGVYLVLAVIGVSRKRK